MPAPPEAAAPLPVPGVSAAVQPESMPVVPEIAPPLPVIPGEAALAAPPLVVPQDMQAAPAAPALAVPQDMQAAPKVPPLIPSPLQAQVPEAPSAMPFPPPPPPPDRAALEPPPAFVPPPLPDGGASAATIKDTFPMTSGLKKKSKSARKNTDKKEEIAEKKLDEAVATEQASEEKPVKLPDRRTYDTVLPNTVYDTRYSRDNVHLPKAVTRLDYARLLFRGAARGDVNAMHALLDAGVDIESRNDHGETALIYATRSLNFQGILTLLARGANPNAMTNNGATALHYAIKGNRADILRLLLERGANPNIADPAVPTPLVLAVVSGDVTLCNRLLAHGADPDLANGLGETALHAAVATNSACLTSLLERRAHVDARDAGGRTPLWLASQKGNGEATRLLLAYGADARLADRMGVEPIAEASRRGQRHVVGALMSEQVRRQLHAGAVPVPPVTTVTAIQ